MEIIGYVSPKRWYLPVTTLRHNPEQHCHLHRPENLKLLLCVDQQQLIWINSLHETSVMQMVSSAYDPPKPLPFCIQSHRFQISSMFWNHKRVYKICKMYFPLKKDFRPINGRPTRNLVRILIMHLVKISFYITASNSSRSYKWPLIQGDSRSFTPAYGAYSWGNLVQNLLINLESVVNSYGVIVDFLYASLWTESRGLRASANTSHV
jgi:hypothetical protein